MREIHYKTRVKRRRGNWHVSVPDLPRDAPRVVTDMLSNAAPLLIERLALYLGVSVSMISVTVEAPVRAERRRGRGVSASLVQLAGAAGVVAGIYLVLGLAATLIAASAAAIVLGALREAGRI